MTPPQISSAAERPETGSDVIHQPELHGAAIPAPIPSEPEQSPQAIPLPTPEEPDMPYFKPEVKPYAPPPKPYKTWQGLSLAPGESEDDFNIFYERLDDHYMPFNEEERVCVGKLAEARWALHRRKKVAEAIESRLYAKTPNAADWSEADFKRLAIADDYRLRAEKLVSLAHQKVHAYVSFRSEDSKWQAYFDLADRRFQLEKEKFERAQAKDVAAA